MFSAVQTSAGISAFRLLENRGFRSHKFKSETKLSPYRSIFLKATLSLDDENFFGLGGK